MSELNRNDSIGLKSRGVNGKRYVNVHAEVGSPGTSTEKVTNHPKNEPEPPD